MGYRFRKDWTGETRFVTDREAREIDAAAGEGVAFLPAFVAAGLLGWLGVVGLESLWADPWPWLEALVAISCGALGATIGWLLREAILTTVFAALVLGFLGYATWVVYGISPAWGYGVGFVAFTPVALLALAAIGRMSARGSASHASGVTGETPGTAAPSPPLKKPRRSYGKGDVALGLILLLLTSVPSTLLAVISAPWNPEARGHASTWLILAVWFLLGIPGLRLVRKGVRRDTPSGQTSTA